MANLTVEELDAGPFLVLVCLAYMLFGMLIAQIYYYWVTYTDDHILLRRYIWLIGVLALAHSIFSLFMIYDYYVANFGNTEAGLSRIPWSARACIVVQIVFVVMTQALYVQRIWILSGHSVFVTALPAFLVFLRFAFGLSNSVFLCVNVYWVGFSGEWKSRLSVNATFVISVMADLVTSGILLYYLATKRGKVSRTTSIVNKLMVYVVNTGAITIVFALTVLFLFNLHRHSLLFAGIYILLGKMYANTMLAMLNARKAVLNPDTDPSGFNSIDVSRGPLRFTERHIQIYTETMVASDVGDHEQNATRSELSRLDSKPEVAVKSEVYALS